MQRPALGGAQRNLPHRHVFTSPPFPVMFSRHRWVASGIRPLQRPGPVRSRSLARPLPAPPRAALVRAPSALAPLWEASNSRAKFDGTLTLLRHLTGSNGCALPLVRPSPVSVITLSLTHITPHVTTGHVVRLVWPQLAHELAAPQKYSTLEASLRCTVQHS